ncbi:MAG: PRD domain-containing protein [Clostridiaceae bacterium]
MFTIKKIYNNNIALVEAKGITKIVTGSGIAFRKKIGDLITDESIEEQFILDKDIQSGSYEEIFKNISPEIFQAINNAINYASKALDVTFVSTSRLAMIDHLYYSIKRYYDNSNIKNPLLWDLKTLYAKEFQVAAECIDIINKALNIQLSQDEGGFITLHFINVTYSEGERNLAVLEAEAVNDILNIIQIYYRITLDKESEKFRRLATHIRYYVRKAAKREASKSKNIYLFNYYKHMHSDAYECALKIKEYSKSKLNFEMNEDELLYFTVHIVNLI